MSSSSLPSHRISPSYAPVGALGSRWTKAGVMSLSPCVQRSFSGLYHPSLMSIADETAEGLTVYGRDKESMSLKDAGLHPQASLFIEIN
ncbi:hypothetical protein IGI04_030716 [Brassica rapa subsp. trilocularis]|uniref:Uncharacterized protein n=1 Tax=Brassica rapa subsp. trilocularis TaxID=1813537 RepID=A0ABQ7LRI8_BRACM|nr:hypothetical protein IGI04_030716 [Brassica rapa subsp. trilocularis]